MLSLGSYEFDDFVLVDLVDKLVYATPPAPPARGRGGITMSM